VEEGIGIVAAETDYSPAKIYKALRTQALNLTAAQVGANDGAYGVLMETGYPEAVVSLLALSDGTASFYFSNGGGIIEAGQKERPAVAARSLVAFAAHNLAHLDPAVDTPLPRPGHIRFYVLTSGGVVTADALEQDLAENRHVLSPLFYAAQELISEIHTSDEA
jgi:hypothetical protein